MAKIMNIKFHIGRWDKALMFQMMGVNSDFWTLVSTVIPTLSYTASNTMVIKFSTTSDISRVKTNKEITIGNTTFNLTTINLTDNTERDYYFNLVVSALREMVIYVLNRGTLPHVCGGCINKLEETLQNMYPKEPRFCHWIKTVSSYWNPNTHSCSNYNVTAPDQLAFEVYEL